MSFETINLGLTLVIPTTGQIQWGPTLKNSTWKKISQHRHEGSGDGNLIQSAGLANGAIVSSKLGTNIAFTQAGVLTPVGTTQTIDLNLGNNQIIDLGSASGDVTATINNPQTGGFYFIKIIQGLTVRTILWPASVLFGGGVNPTLHQNISTVNLIVLYYDGTNFLATICENELY